MVQQKPVDDDRPSVTSLSEADKALIFRMATSGLTRCYGDRFKTGLSDEELSDALQEVLGIFGGSGGPDQPSITFQGAGLKIWGGWHVVNHVQEKPLFQGKVTIAMARELYAIPNPDENQMQLF